MKSKSDIIQTWYSVQVSLSSIYFPIWIYPWWILFDPFRVNFIFVRCVWYSVWRVHCDLIMFYICKGGISLNQARMYWKLILMSKTILKRPTFVPFGFNMTNFAPNLTLVHSTKHQVKIDHTPTGQRGKVSNVDVSM